MSKNSSADRPDESIIEAARGLLGYLNFSNGSRDYGAFNNWNLLFGHFGVSDLAPVHEFLQEQLQELQAENPAFRESTQATNVLDILFSHMLDAYYSYHHDLLFHFPKERLIEPFFIATLAEAVLAQQSTAQDVDSLVQNAILHVNDFIGYRPVALLENGRMVQPYPHEKSALIPLYFRETGTAVGKYQDLIQKTLSLLEKVPETVITATHFLRRNLDELAVDVRAYDYNHPVFKRTNYLFGEWDPHRIGLDGYYHRFVVRSIILDSLIDWIQYSCQLEKIPYEEALFDASAALGGTILMASSISGSGPDTFDSTVSLSSLLPIVARQRDFFYEHLMSEVDGPRAERLYQQQQVTQQPFGHVRHALNMFLSNYGAQQVRNRELALMYARMGYAEESRRQSEIIPAASIRFETEIQWRIRIIQQHNHAGEFEQSLPRLTEIKELYRRGVECGAFIDPWNILGFQGQFNLFSNRDDSVPDVRVEILIDVMEQIFSVHAETLTEAAIAGREEIISQLSDSFKTFAEHWDDYATTTVEDIPKLYGLKTYESAMIVARTLLAWHKADPEENSLAFWRTHVEMFDSHLAYHNIVSVLLDKRDLNSAFGLLMQWFSQIEESDSVQFDETFSVSLLEWANLLRQSKDDDSQLFDRYRRSLELLEANAGSRWGMPRMSIEASAAPPSSEEDDQDWWDEPALDGPWGQEEEEDPDSPFAAAYEGVTFRDSADDGQEGSLSDGSSPYESNEFERWGRSYESQLKFLQSVAELQQQAIIVAARLLRKSDAEEPNESKETSATVRKTIVAWSNTLFEFERELGQFLHEIHLKQLAPPSGSHDANIEYDIQLQSKLYLMHNVIWTLTRLRFVRRLADSLLYDGVKKPKLKDVWLTEFLHAILSHNITSIKELLPKALKRLSRRKLLYMPLENGGTPRSIADAQEMHALLRFLVTALPALGMYRETWQVMVTAYDMERSSRPRGPAITEFDRLFRLALSNTLSNMLKSSQNWRSGKLEDSELIDILTEVVDHYRDIWLRHSETMRLSAAEAMNVDSVWQDTIEFIHKYGSDLFHARNLTLGYVRAIVQTGVEEFLQYLDENDDPIHPNPLIEDLRDSVIEPREAAAHLEMIYGILIDKFDRFLEYNSTTTHSDYGERFDCFLDFVRLEAEYDRDDWNYTPYRIAHEALIEIGRYQAAQNWEHIFAIRSSEQADEHLLILHDLEAQYGVKLPALKDHIEERFVKPIAINRMLALVREIMEEKDETVRREYFDDLRVQIEQYQDGTSGTGLEVPEWLRVLDQELRNFEAPEHLSNDPYGEQIIIPVTINLREMRRQLKTWNDDFMPNPRKQSKRPRDKS